MSNESTGHVPRIEGDSWKGTVGFIAACIAIGAATFAIVGGSAAAPTSLTIRDSTGTAKYLSYQFSAGGLSNGPSAAMGWRLAAPVDGAKQVALLAKYVGVTGPVQNLSLGGFGSWRVSGPTGVVTYHSGAGQIPNWRFASTVQSNGNAVAGLARVASQMDYGYTAKETGNGVAVIVDGWRTDLAVGAGWNDGRVYMSGPAFFLSRSQTWPLAGMANGVSSISRIPLGWAMSGVTAWGATTSVPRSSRGPVPTTMMQWPTHATPSPRYVEVTSATLSLRAVVTLKGEWWLLPSYTYAGVVVAPTGASVIGTWSVPALASSLKIKVTNPLVY